MRFRTICGTAILLSIGILVYLDARFFPTRPIASCLMTFVAGVGWIEFSRLTGISGGSSKSHPGLHLLGLTGVLYFFAVTWLGADGRLPGSLDAWTMAGIWLLAFLAFLAVVLRPDFERAYVSLLETIAGVLLLGLLFSYVLRIYKLPGWDGPVAWGILILGVKGNDTAAYYIGKTWGRHPMVKVSPKKTWEGAAGAIAFSLLYFAAAAPIAEAVLSRSLFSWPGGMLLGMIISVASQAGDLAESLVKRIYQVKDSGTLLPEFGGVLDMIDSLVFTGCIFWWMIHQRI